MTGGRKAALRRTGGFASSLEHRRAQLYLALMFFDACALFAGYLLGGCLYIGQLPAPSMLFSARLLLPLYLILAVYQGVYSVEPLASWRLAVQRVAISFGISVALFILFMYYAKSSESISRVAFSLGTIFTFALLGLSRLISTGLIRRTLGEVPLNVLIIDDGGPAVDLPHAYRVTTGGAQLVPGVSDPHKLDAMGRLFQNMDRIIVSCAMDRRVAWANSFRAIGVRGEVVSDALHEFGTTALVREKTFTSLVISTGPLALRSRALKRAFDLALSSVGLLLLAPFLLLIAALIKLEDGGPVFFVQRRVGRGNRFFDVLKFRSMRVTGADADGVQSTARDDQRITRLGKFLRRTSLDEIPQLINVLRGDMSLVGPRPHALGSQAGAKLFWEVDSRYWNRHSLKPGLTGLAQIRGFRGATDREEDLTERLRADLEYIAGWSLWKDVWILLQTVRVVVHDRAY